MPKDPYYINQVETGSGCTVHYCLDAFNKRLRVDDYEGNVYLIFERVCGIAGQHALTKLFIKSRQEDWETFLSNGCMLEGIYKGYFDGRDAYCMAYYMDLERRTSDYWIEEDRILRQVLELPLRPDRSQAADGAALRMALPDDTEALAALYGRIFKTYPVPMHDPSYVEKAMLEGTLFYVVEQAGELISAASAEINTVYRNAEMTDCATLPAHRGKGHMRLLLHALEDELAGRNIRCLYSLSRALSLGMNAVFRQMGYRYCGRLTKNCDIYDKFEDMNLWVKL
ncbi:putative beta-lysine N-acetyltransferase [Paenibacillus sp. Soil522]|uniref:putative beta-lysine N-acetyltransferase n=1 Tax=Paenibacillus sp. Soil522 TaxID=1736388 RepID=UPI0006F27F4C|nr:putative beta-lysine N-acetyltransferase [Paenibacillus sp. Soil522]KRE47372.1 beta-lysine acetyltransferase [Paenibacillus sp. Soil522]